MDTDKYEGHSEGPWKCEIPETGDDIVTDAEGLFVANVAYRDYGINARLIADAPLFLDFILWVKNTHPHYYHKLTKAYQGAKNNR